MELTEENLKLITREILPPNCDFFDQQKDAIKVQGSVNIVAGPGSGKTTVLIAKCALLLQELSLNKGVCLITHTNVAVDEIKEGLKRIGMSNIEYPHFIGTIQEFFNTFFSKKAFYMLNSNRVFRVLDDDEYQEKFSELFIERKPAKYDYSVPRFSNKNPKLKINDNFTFEVSSNAPNFYRWAFNSSIETLFKRGYLTNYQCLELANWYITKFEEKLKLAMSNRFSYVLLDEAQDTSKLQYQLLNKLFKNGSNNFQKFGDPYQALYNIYEGNEDAWMPFKEAQDENIPYQEIAETSRFGSSIASVVKSICIEKYDTFRSLDVVQSFNPYYIFYENEIDITVQYRELIKCSEMKSQSFANSIKKDTILSAHHSDLKNLFSNYEKPATTSTKKNNKVKSMYEFLLGVLAKELDISFKELKDLLDLNAECKIIISKCIQIMNRDKDTVLIINYLNDVLSILSDNASLVFSQINIEGQLEYYLQNYNRSEVPKENAEFYIGTIHSVKGETHRSTLLVMDTVFSALDNSWSFSKFDLLKDYLCREYINPYTIKDGRKRNETIKALKLAYVALSRPTHLMAIAIPKKYINENETFDSMDSKGWKRFVYGPTSLF